MITDMGLPKLDGSRLFLQMQRINPEVKVVLASGYIDPDLKRDLLAAGIKAFIQKPYKPDIVLKQLRSVLDQA